MSAVEFPVRVVTVAAMAKALRDEARTEEMQGNDYGDRRSDEIHMAISNALERLADRIEEESK